MYRGELYRDFLQADCVKQWDGRIATINAVTLLPEHRYGSKSKEIVTQSQVISYSDKLLSSMLNQLRDQKVILVLLSAIEGPSFALMKRQGFSVINPPHQFEGPHYSTHKTAKTITVYDMVIILESGHSNLTKYVDERHFASFPEWYLAP
jgi:hypothetical protein